MNFEIDKLRIFIIDEQKQTRSGCWYFLGVGDGVYIGPEVTGRTLKLSFHANDVKIRDGCNSQWGLTNDYKISESQLGTTDLPPLARWNRPETPLVGSAQVASIMFPTDFLGGTISPFKSGRKRISLPMAPPHRAIEVGVFYSREEPSTIEAGLNKTGGICIGYMNLPGGENVIVATREVPFEPILLAYERDGVGRALSVAPKVGEVVDNCGGVALLDIPADGHIVVLAELNGAIVKRDYEGDLHAAAPSMRSIR